MCGIVGFTHKDGTVDRELIRRATRSLLHRGPDQVGGHQSDCVSLGAVRLKIIDLEGGDQPVASDDRDTVLVFNGEIYNYLELRQELEGRGHRFRSRSDTEVLLHAFLEWDTDCFSRLRGMFAAALWTESRRRLVLARDRLGIKPLYFHRRGNDIYFGSELKAILEHPEVERTLNLEGLDYYLSLNYVPCPHTLIEGIEKLPPGYWLEWRDGRVRSEPYWRLEIRPQASRTLESAKEELDWLLREAIREHLISDVPLGIWASGGLDSSTILHYAAAQSSSRLKTFSISFRGRSFDETPYFREVAKHYGTEHHEIDLNPSPDLPAVVEEMVYYSDEPSADAGALPVWFLARMSRQHATVALSGEGADELFGGYITYQANNWCRLLRRVPAPVRRFAQRMAGYLPVSDDKISFEYKLKRFLEGSFLAPDDAHSYWNGAFSSAQKQEFYLAGGGPNGLFRPFSEPSGKGILSRYLWFDQLYYLPDDILYKVDRMSMAHSLEVRPAFLDHRIVEFAASLPESLKIRGLNHKFILRELMKDRLPASILRRKKEGLDIPAHEWLRTVLRPLLLDTLTPKAVEAAGVFRPEAVQQMIHNHLERHANLGFHLWGLLTLFLWMKRWHVRPLMAARDRREMAPAYTTG
ncbi:MAG: asparagine synthase (glutamine-hydrolyzing) [Acidobacteria bacterium]|nr:asparagine synthase (glutamine-hydrolyzing) [Acidobacteriota bacterium]